MKKLVFIGIFIFLLLAGSASAETEKKYLSIGGDPVMKDICAKKKIKTFFLPEDTFSATVSKSRKVSVGWLHKGEEIGWLNKEQTDYVICRCGNSVKFLQPPQEIEQPKVEKIPSEPEPKIEPETKPKLVIPAVEEVEIIFVEDYPEEVYVPVERSRSWGWFYGGGGGYVTGGRVISGGYHRDSHRHDNYRRDRYHPSRPRAHSRGGPGPDPPN